jgi:iron complex transport system substrate-binding protein
MSLNVCTDQLVMAIADPQQIVSLSALADDPALSNDQARAAAHRKNRGLAEEVLAARPDVVVTGTYSLHNTTELLARLGIVVDEFDFVQALDTIPGEVRRLGRIIDRQHRAEAIAAGFERALLDLSVEATAASPTILAYGQNGVVLGSGTLADSVMKAAGFRNLAAERGVFGMAPYPLELVVVDHPDVILLSAPLDEAPSLADRISDHPALAASGAALHVGVVPDGTWTCAGPFTIEALRALRALRDTLTTDRGS